MSTTMDTRPSTYNILTKYFAKVIIMREYIQDTVSTNRYARIAQVARANDSLRTLLDSTYICYNPTLSIVDDDGLDYTSILPTGEQYTQAEVYLSCTVFIPGCASRVEPAAVTTRCGD